MTLVLGLSLTNNLVFRRTSSAPERSVSRSSTNSRKKPRTGKNLGRKSKPISDQDFFEKDIALQFLRPSSHKVLLRPQPPPTPHHAKYLIEIPVNQGTKTRRSRSLRNTLTPDMSQSRRNSRYIVSYDGNQKTSEKEKENKTIDARLNLTSREDQSIRSNPVKGSSKVENKVDSSKIDETTNKQSRNKNSDKQHLSQPQLSQASSSAQVRRPSMIAKSKDKQLPSKNGNEGKKPEEHGQGVVASGKTDEPSKLGSNPAIKNNTAKPQSDDSSGKTERRDSSKKEAESNKKRGGSDEQSANENRRDSHKSETSSEVSSSGKVVDRSESTEGEQKSKDGDTPEGDLDRSQTPESLDSDGEFVEETEEEKLVDQRLIRLLSGRLDNLPPVACKVVRIFTSSTFTDTTLERNCLMENVYPKLKEYCRESYGLDFQVVDMRWGVRDEATDDHMTTDLCMNEIDNCQRLSLGPNFCVFLGQKYGYRPIPTIILGTELDMLREVIKEFYPEDAVLVDKWYKLDENAVPPVYVLQPISSILVNFNNKRTQKLMEQDQNTWWSIMGKLQVMLRKGALELFIARKMNREEMHNYVMSVTEREVRRGIINAQDVDKHCLAYFRQIDQINLGAVRVARNFIDMIGKDVDEEAEYLLSILRDEHVPTKLSETNIVRFTVEWTGDNGLDFETHAEYLRQFCEIFYRDITDLVDKGMKEAINYGIYNLLFAEVLHHSQSCVTLCKSFKGREEVLEVTKCYVTGESTQPLIYWGEGGCGKTSLVAKGFSLVESWFPESTDPLMILRFLGTSPDSSSLIPLLTSLCRQIYFFYNHTYDNNIPSELTPLVSYLRSLLSLATTNQPIILFLDSIDQLSSANGAHQLTWFPLELPPNCKLVVSVVSDYFGILDRLRKVFPTSNNFINIPSLGQELGTIVIKAMLANANRTVSDSQWYIVQQAIEGCSVPLYIKMVFGEMTRWRSYHSRYLTTLALNIHDSIIKLFERIENQHGRVLVSHAFGYVTLSKGGITETELEDLISLDEKVLNDVYQYHLPPVRRIPPLLWTRIRNDLSHYFTEREADGVNVINWYHRQFKEVSRERYFRNLNVLADTHSLMADYFLGIWGGVSKPFEYTDLQCQRFGLDTAAGTCDRKVPEQPLCYADKLGKVTRYNLRKLSEQPYHLVRSHRYDDLYKKVLFNFRWLHAKLTCMPLQSILEDFEDALSFQADPIVKLMMDALRLSASVISRNPDMLAAQIVGRLIPYYDSQERIRDLIQQCDTDGVLVNALIPSHHCLHTPGGPLEYSLEGHPFAPFGVSVTSDGHYLVSASSKFIVWDLMTGESVRQTNPGVKGIMRQLTMTSDDSKAITYSNNNQVIICTVRTGDIKLIEDVAVGKDEIVNMTLNSSKFLIWSAKDWFVFSLDGNPIDTGSLAIKDSTIVHIYLGDGDDRYLIWKTGNSNGVDSNIEMTLAVSSGLGPSPDGDRLQFHSAVALTKKKRTVYACADPQTMDVARFDRNREGSGWNRKWAFENEEKIYSLLFSSDETLLVAILPFAYKKWNLEGSEKTDTEAVVMALPKGARNFPYKTCLRHVVVFTKDNEYLVSAVRKIMYIFRVETGALLKTLDVHFGRIISLTAVTGGMNKIISASIDKTIKVWNMENITENVHPISRQEKSIEKVASCCTPERSLAVTTTRNCVGIWNMETGRLMTTLASSKLSSIVTHSVVTSDAKYIVSAESGVINIWNIETERLLKSDNSCLSDVQHMTLTSEDTKLIVVRRNNEDKNKAICECHKIPAGGLLYRFEYTIRTIKEFVVTSDGVHMVHVGVNTKNIEVLIVHVVESGCFVVNSRPKYSRFREFTRIVAMPTHPNRVAIIDDEKGNIWDWKKKSLVRSIPKWNGMCTKDGKYGLYAPNRGGLDLLDLKTGTKLSTLIPRIAEGVFSIRVMFTANDQHVIYYHSGQRSIRVFRVPDGTKIADYKCHAEITDLTSGHGGRSLVLGAIDGSLVVLIIADSSIDSNLEFLKSMHDPSSKSVSEEPVELEDEIAII